MYTLYRGECDNKHEPLPTLPAITITKDGRIKLNTALTRLIPDSWNYVQLYYDANYSKLCIKLARADAEGARLLGRSKGYKGRAVITGFGFMKFFNLDMSETRRYAANYNHTKLSIFVDLE